MNLLFPWIDSQRFRFEVDSQNLQQNGEFNFRPPQTKLSLIYNFGNQELKTKKIKLTSPLPTPLEIEHIHKEIESQTIQKAGSEMNISEEEINLKIYSPFVPNLNLIDLPGLTMVACTDKGQPKDIKIKIRRYH